MKIYFRAIEDEDLVFLANLVNDNSTNYYLFSNIPVSRSRQGEFISRLRANKTKLWLIITNNDHSPLGLIRLDNVDYVNKTVEIGISIDKQFRGQGYGYCSYLAGLRYIFCNTSMNKVYLYVFSFNRHAVKLYKKIGFKIEGILRKHKFKHGHNRDVVIMSMLRSEWERQGFSDGNQ